MPRGPFALLTDRCIDNLIFPLMSSALPGLASAQQVKFCMQRSVDACYKQFNVTRHLPTPTPEPTVVPVLGPTTYEGVLKQLIDVMIRLRALLMTQI